MLYFIYHNVIVNFYYVDGDFHSTSSTGDSLKHPVACACEHVESEKIEARENKETLELVWMKASGMCTPSSLKKFLLKRGKLVSIILTQGNLTLINSIRLCVCVCV